MRSHGCSSRNVARNRPPHQSSGHRGSCGRAASRAGVGTMTDLPAMEAARARLARRRSMARGEAVEAPPTKVSRHRTGRTAFSTTESPARPSTHSGFPAISHDPSADRLGNTRVKNDPRGVTVAQNRGRRRGHLRKHHRLDGGQENLLEGRRGDSTAGLSRWRRIGTNAGPCCGPPGYSTPGRRSWPKGWPPGSG